MMYWTARNGEFGMACVADSDESDVPPEEPEEPTSAVTPPLTV